MKRLIHVFGFKTIANMTVTLMKKVPRLHLKRTPPHLGECQKDNKLAIAKSIDDFYSKDGMVARLFSDTVEHMLENVAFYNVLGVDLQGKGVTCSLPRKQKRGSGSSRLCRR
jgi:hypothetical protein